MGNRHVDMGLSGVRSRNFFRSGELHLVLLALLSSRAQHGYELMSELQTRFGNSYRPSPGSVYPALSALEAEGLVIGEEDGERRIFRLGPLGRDALEARRTTLTAIEARTGARLGGDTTETVVAHLASRVRAAAATLGPDQMEALEAVLLDAADRIEELATQGGRQS